MKHFREKIKRAKAAVDTRIPSSIRPPTTSTRSTESYGEDPLKTYLRQFRIQQYYKKLVDLGYQVNLYRLATLSDTEIEDLSTQLRLLPGHQGRFMEMLSSVRQTYSRGRQVTSMWTAHSLSPHHITLSPGKFIRTLSNDLNNSGHKGNNVQLRIQGSESTSAQSDREREARKLSEELAKARIKIMILEHQLEEKGQTKETEQAEKAETPENFSKKSITFNIDEEKAVEKLTKPRLKRSEIGLSYDSSKMRSTLVNLDIEEMCKCLSKALKSHIQSDPVPVDAPQECQQRHSTRQSSTSSLRYSDSRTIPNPFLIRFEEVFFEPFRIPLSIEETEIYNFARNVLVRAKMEKEVAVISLAYLERLQKKTGLSLTNYTWKRLVFIAMVLASKIWDDDSYENKNFAEAFTMYSASEINSMESTFLALLDFDLNVKGGEYAKTYFALRTFCDAKNRSFPLKALDVETVRRLQANASRAESCLRDIHAESLYKTL